MKMLSVATVQALVLGSAFVIGFSATQAEAAVPTLNTGSSTISAYLDYDTGNPENSLIPITVAITGVNNNKLSTQTFDGGEGNVAVGAAGASNNTTATFASFLIKGGTGSAQTEGFSDFGAILNSTSYDGFFLGASRVHIEWNLVWDITGTGSWSPARGYASIPLTGTLAGVNDKFEFATHMEWSDPLNGDAKYRTDFNAGFTKTGPGSFNQTVGTNVLLSPTSLATGRKLRFKGSMDFYATDPEGLANGMIDPIVDSGDPRYSLGFTTQAFGATPEPATMSLALAGVLALGAVVTRRRE